MSCRANYVKDARRKQQRRIKRRRKRKKGKRRRRRRRREKQLQPFESARKQAMYYLSVGREEEEHSLGHCKKGKRRLKRREAR
jgi:hypothetical protein